MSQGRELFALEWVKGELLQTLSEAHQALEAYAEMGRDETRMRVCLTRMHQVHGTLVMLELTGVALLADYLERLAQALLDQGIEDVDAACEVLMQGIIELPERLEHIHGGGEDSEQAVLELVNRAVALLGLDPLLAADALDQDVSQEALARFEQIDGPGKIRRIRAAYQNVLLAILKGENEERSIDTLKKVAVGLERICAGAPAETQWQAFGEFVDSLRDVKRPLPADVVKMLRRIDAEIRRFARDGTEAFLAPVPKVLVQQLLDAASARGPVSERGESIRSQVNFESSGEDMALSGKQALAEAAVALREELALVKDRIDLFVRADERDVQELEELKAPLRQMASTCTVLGFESSRTVILDQVAAVEALLADANVDAQSLLSIASALVQVEENLAGVSGGVAPSEPERYRTEAQTQVLVECRGVLEAVKQAVVDFVSSDFALDKLAPIPEQIFGVCGALEMTDVIRPIAALRDCRAFVEQELIGYSQERKQVQWERLDRFADCVSGIDYYLERMADESRVGADEIIEVVERSLKGLGFEARGAELGPPSEQWLETRIAVEASEEPAETLADATAVVEAKTAHEEAPLADAEVAPMEDPVATSDEAPDLSAAAQDLQEDEYALAPEAEAADHEIAPEPQVEETATEPLTLEGDEDVGELAAEPLEEIAVEEESAPVHTPPTPSTPPTPFDAQEVASSVSSALTLLADEVLAESAELAPEEAKEETASAEEESAVEDTPSQLASEVATVMPVLPAEPETAALAGAEEADAQERDVEEASPEETIAEQATDQEAEPAPESPSVSASFFETSPVAASTGTEPEVFDLSDSQFDELVGDEGGASAEADEEIVEIFCEEAEEVLEAIGEQWAQWQPALNDTDLCTEIRRGFHTLKGSGRMVGAELIGELSWSVENMLNRLLDGTVEPSADIAQTVDEARHVLIHLRQQFRQGEPADETEVRRLVDVADVLASGGSLAENQAAGEQVDEDDSIAVFTAEVREHLDVIRAHTGRRRVQLDDNAMRSVHTLVGATGVAEYAELHELTEQLYEVARAQRADALRGPNTEVETARLFQDAIDYLTNAVELLERGEPLQADEELTQRAKSLLSSADETPSEEMLVGLAQLDVVLNANAKLDQWVRDSAEPGFQEAFIGAMEAIIGSTFRPQVTDLARSVLSVVVQEDPEESLDPQVSQVLKVGCERLLAAVDAIAADRALPRVDDVITQLGDAAVGGLVDFELDEPVAAAQPATDDSAPEPIEEPASEPVYVTPNPVAAEQPEDAEPIDPELAEVFFEEADELLETMEASLHDWRSERNNRLHLETLLRALHTLKGGARLAGFSQVGDRVHHFESFLIDAQNDELEVDDRLFERSDHSYDEVAALLASVRGASPEQQASVTFANTASLAPAPPSPSEPEGKKPEVGVVAEPRRQAPVTTQPLERGGQEMVRVRAGLLESLVNLAGENSILRARVEQGMSDFSGALEEMETTIERTREQLRRLEIETEAQVLYRQERLDPGYDSFDPLEMDRYSKLQQLSRALSESASDMLDLKDTLLFKASEAETLLLQQARINTELQEGLMRTRMVPFSRLLPRLRKIVRQISAELGKEVDFHAYNAEGELDRNLLERMIPPLEHMLRNAVDHGIEPSEVRRSFGKGLPGRIDLRLSREGGDIVIEIEDDGAGIDIESVRAKAMEKGLMHPDAGLADEEVMEYVLAPGFSTAKSVTQISGRGVGLDVVNSEVKQLGGSVSISSALGKGTKFVVRVPFTVSVNRALMVCVGDDLYAVPLNTIEGIVLLDPEHVRDLYDAEEGTLDYAGVAYRVRYLGHYIGRQYVPVSDTAAVPVVLVRSGDQAIAVHVDAVQGSREIVVKSLGPQFAGVGGISGATILGDGSVVVILDLLALIRSRTRESIIAHRQEAQTLRRNPCVMVVDDSVTVRKVTARLLERRGIDVVVAKDGVEAVAMLQERRPDVMLLDIEMPRMDGFEVARQVRHDDRLLELPIIMISSRTGQKHTEHAKELGVNRFLGKPFQENELISAIDELVRETGV